MIQGSLKTLKVKVLQFTIHSSYINSFINLCNAIVLKGSFQSCSLYSLPKYRREISRIFGSSDEEGNIQAISNWRKPQELLLTYSECNNMIQPFNRKKSNFSNIPCMLISYILTQYLPDIALKIEKSHYIFNPIRNDKKHILQKKKKNSTRHVSSMIHSARPTVSPVATIIFCCFVLLDLKSTDGRTNGRTTCAKIMITTGRDCGSADWIKKSCNLV